MNLSVSYYTIGLSGSFAAGCFYSCEITAYLLQPVCKFMSYLCRKNKNMNSTDIETVLSRKGVKPTPNRILVVKELMKALRPVSLADLEISLGFSMDKASIFRVLELFSEKDVVHVIEDGSRSLKYELCHSSNHSISDQHVHFYCEQCKETYCFESVNVPLINIPDGFSSHTINYMIKGICPKCAKRL